LLAGDAMNKLLMPIAARGFNPRPPLLAGDAPGFDLAGFHY
jgi:hypothetical protein